MRLLEPNPYKSEFLNDVVSPIIGQQQKSLVSLETLSSSSSPRSPYLAPTIPLIEEFIKGHSQGTKDEDKSAWLVS
ncbi:unnamed protein product, partial [Brassica oleracea]